VISEVKSEEASGTPEMMFYTESQDVAEQNFAHGNYSSLKSI
jgi:hypothetical protein